MTATRTATIAALLAGALHAQGADLGDLFAAPTGAELAAVEADWASRDTSVNGWQVEASGTMFDGYFAEVVSHVVDGNRHYGLIRYPKGFDAGASYPVLINCHGGNNGVGYGGASALDGMTPGTCVEDEVVMVVPSYRGETLSAGPLGTYLSEGSPETFDGDIDDTIALLSGTLEHVPQADEQRILCYGASRGGGVTLITSVRDDRIRAAVALFAATDHTHPSVQDACEAKADDPGHPLGNPVNGKAWELAVEPYLAGDMTLAEARHVLIACSMSFFVERLPRLQVHHGTGDMVVPFEQGVRLDQAMAAAGIGAPCFGFFAYPGGGHNPGTLPGWGATAEALLCAGVQGSLGTLGVYGGGCPLSSGQAPGLGVTGCFTAGGNIQLRGAGAGGALAVVFVAGTQAGSLPLGGGCSLLVSPLLVIGPTLTPTASGTANLFAHLPPALSATISLQGFALDTSLPGLVAATDARLLSY